jgi:hypothetical protein
MSDLLSATKSIKAVHDVSDVLYIPATILALWFQFEMFFVANNSGSVLLAQLNCCFLGLLGCVTIHKIICWTGARFNNLPVYPIISTTFVAIGLITLFPTSFSTQLTQASQFSGFALLAWGFMLDKLSERIAAKGNAA